MRRPSGEQRKADVVFWKPSAESVSRRKKWLAAECGKQQATIGFGIMRRIQRKRESLEMANIQAFLGVSAGRRAGWSSVSSFVLRWEKLCHVCVLMELSEREGDDAGEKLGELLKLCPWDRRGLSVTHWLRMRMLRPEHRPRLSYKSTSKHVGTDAGWWEMWWWKLSDDGFISLVN